jgi:serine/threonine-protein kinase HipA
VKAVPTDDYILLKRYDCRYQDGSPVRLHQEDLCQALGIPPFRKYQREGGVGFARVVDLIREHSATPLHDIRSLVTWQLATLILGNADGHVKNVSLLYDGGQRTLAPVIDRVCRTIRTQIRRTRTLTGCGLCR